MLKNVGGGAFLADDAVGHVDDVARNVAGKGHLVGDDDHRQALFGQLAHDGQYLADHLRVKGGRRLVEKQHLGLHRQGAGNRNALLLAAGKLARLDKKTPCAITGACADCLSPDCICNQVVITRRSGIKGRIKVLLIGESFGY